MIFELKESDRRYLGLNEIEDTWQRKEINENCIYYVDNESFIRKVCYIFPDPEHMEALAFLEKDTYYKLDDEVILTNPKRGTKKKLSASNLFDLKAMNVRFLYRGKAEIFNQASYIKYCSSPRLEDFSQLRTWLDSYIDDTTVADLAEIAEFKVQTKKHFVPKDGDFFSFKIDRRTYGFGRVIFNAFQYARKNKATCKDDLPLFFEQFFEAPVIVKFYLYVSDTPYIDTNILKSKKSLPSFSLSEYYLWIGQYPIIGNAPLEPDEYDFPIMVHELRYFQWGWIYKTSNRNQNRHSFMFSTYTGSPNGYEKDLLISCIQEDSLDPYWRREAEPLIMDGRRYIDFRNPAFAKDRLEVFNAFGIDISKSYWENLEIFNQDK